MVRKTMKEFKYVFVGYGIVNGSKYICELYKFIVLCVNICFQKYK